MIVPGYFRRKGLPDPEMFGAPGYGFARFDQARCSPCDSLFAGLRHRIQMHVDAPRHIKAPSYGRVDVGGEFYDHFLKFDFTDCSMITPIIIGDYTDYFLITIDLQETSLTLAIGAISLTNRCNHIKIGEIPIKILRSSGTLGMGSHP
jgi:hypothetical protein